VSVKERINTITVQPTVSILAALRRMDEVGYKLLLLRDGDIFCGLLSVGDIQRAIIKNADMSAPITSILRKEFLTCSETMTREEIKRALLRSRSVFMPIISQERKLLDVVFWDEFYPSNDMILVEKLELPVVIMAGGVGSRLRPLTHVLPKPLLPIGEKTIIETIMDKFVQVGCRKFYLSLNYKASLIRHYFKELNEAKYEITCVEEDEPLGTAGSLSLLRYQLKQTFFVSNCDIIIDQEIEEVLKYHRENRNELTIVAALKHIKLAYGALVTGTEGLLESLEEKPELVFKVNSGVYVLEPHVLDEIPKDTFFNMTQLIDGILARNGRVGVFPISEGSWTDIGNWDDYQKCILAGQRV
jgi:dTDP-glucose pyrophosphorylase